MKKNFLSAKENDYQNPHYQDYIQNMKLVRTFLEDTYDKPFHSVNISSEELDMFMNDYQDQSDELIFLTGIAEDYLDKQIVYFGDDEKRIDNAVGNSVFYYPKYEVAIAKVYGFTANGTKGGHYIFYANEEKCLAFSVEAQKRIKEMHEKEIYVFTDTQNGPLMERQRVNELIDRSEVVLEEKLKKDIFTSIDHFFKENGEFYKKYKIPHKRGILLYGEPGNGKTTLIKSLVGSIPAPVVYWQVNEYTRSHSVSEVFDTVSTLSPAVLVIEDLDTLPESTRSTFLNTLDGATTKEGVFVIGTTNYPERVDKALINRAGRFDRTYEMKLPNQALRYEYLKVRGTGDFLSEEEMSDIAEKTEGFSFVQLSEIFRQVAFAIYHGEETQIDEIIATLKENNRKAQKNAWSSKEEKNLGFTS